ncbi:hypothetical protein KY359_06010, partial [Candidatus Woesearchaeota archaeon]|nr:hypothetical protein [Candidatus Woesearchaeota archaeon]
QLEELKQDVFDLRLELKLAKDKIKSGNFNMVQIYLDGLTPRVQKIWDKLGKKPKKLEIQLMDAAEIQAAVDKAKEERAKKAQQEGAQQPAGGQAQEEEKKELTPDEISQKEEQIKELQGQIETAIGRNDKNMAAELFKEIQPIVDKFPDTKKKEWQPKIDSIKQKIGG